jgi:hypothetical protein
MLPDVMGSSSLPKGAAAKFLGRRRKKKVIIEVKAIG